jgi:hypothetical protein
MPKTRKGIYHNLRESKYTVSNSEAVFFFSSELYLKKFLDGYTENRKKYSNVMNMISETPFNFDTFADIEFYKETEKRGFFVRLHKSPASLDDLYKYSIRQMTFNESPEWTRNEVRNGR